jgi:tetratricopeptide (TPR) repeat protein
MRDTVPSNAVLRAASWFEASRGSVAEARATLDRLDPSHAAAGEIQIIHADFEADFGTAQSAVSAYQAATQEAPTNPQTWTALAEYQLRHRNFTAVCSTADSGLRWFPTDPKLSALKRQSSSLSRLLPDANFQPLIDALATDPTSVPAITLLHELLASQSSNETSDKALQRLTAVAQQNPRFLPAQLILASRFAEAGLYDDAARIAQQASESWPASAQPLKLLAQIHASANHWQLSLTAARDWRNHSLSHPQPADNSIALAMEHLGQADQAQAALSPYLPRAMPAVLADPDADSDDATTISLLARAMAMQHHLEEVRIMLEPLSQKSARWRKERETVSAG